MENVTEPSKQSSKLMLIVIVGVVLGGLIAWGLISMSEPEPQPKVVVELPEPEIVAPEVIEEPIIEDALVKPEIEVEPVELVEIVPEITLPELDESDEIVQQKLATITWRKELLKLVIDDDMIRRFVVFTDNFANGNVVYSFSPLVSPDSKFSAKDNGKSNQDVLQWDPNTSKRFNLYMELLQSMDVDSLVQWYFDLKPLIDKAYGELGYSDSNFTVTLQTAIDRVLDMQIPESTPELIRPSVMFKYKDQKLEKLSDADKLLLRIGKDNLLVLKSLLLKINEKIEAKKR